MTKTRLEDGRLIKIYNNGRIEVDLEDEKTRQIYKKKIKEIAKWQQEMNDKQK